MPLGRTVLGWFRLALGLLLHLSEELLLHICMSQTALAGEGPFRCVPRAPGQDCCFPAGAGHGIVAKPQAGSLVWARLCHRDGLAFC